MNDFDSEKKEYLNDLYKPDFSKKGNVDKEIAYFIDKINSFPNYYTTSSCAGRIVLIQFPKNSNRKDEAKWLYTTHKKAKFDDLPLKSFPKEMIWFRMEAAILHVCCRTIESAQELVNNAKFVGFKRSGIMATKKRLMVEMTSTEHMDVPISVNGKLIVDKDYIKILVKEANKKLMRSRAKTKKFFDILNNKK